MLAGRRTDVTIEIIDKNSCTGCGACANVCPYGCISMQSGEYGFYSPIVSKENCVECGLCEKRCPILSGGIKNSNSELPQVFAAWSLDNDIRLCSTSGGVFSEFAKYVLSVGGSVVGARYTKDHLVEHCIIDDVADLEKIRQSKYIQSFTGNIFKEIKKNLDKGSVVAFCGSPCQVAGLLSFLHDNPENLITLDFICHGMNSPMAYTSYLDMLAKKYKSRVKRVWFKNKTYGWNRFSTRIDFENGEQYLQDRNSDLFMRGYIEQNLYMRSCCFDCHYKKFPRVADITLGDFWGVADYKPSLDQDLGTSLIMLNSAKSEQLFENIKDNIYSEKCSIDVALPGNACIFENAVRNPKSDKFMTLLKRYPFDKSFRKVVESNRHSKCTKSFIGFSKKVLKYIARKIR